MNADHPLERAIQQTQKDITAAGMLPAVAQLAAVLPLQSHLSDLLKQRMELLKTPLYLVPPAPIDQNKTDALVALDEATRIADKSKKIDRERIVGRAAVAHLTTIRHALAAPAEGGQGGALLSRAYEVVHHEDDCPAIGGHGDDDCRCDAVPFLRDLRALIDSAGGAKGEELITVQQAWEWAGGNPGIKATKQELIDALRTLDEVCDDADTPQPAEGDGAVSFDAWWKSLPKVDSEFPETMDDRTFAEAAWNAALAQHHTYTRPAATAVVPDGCAPSIAAAEAMGAHGAPSTEGERLAFEAWMRGHCWSLCATWNGTEYRSDAEQGGRYCPQAASTRQLWAAWRDRAALATGAAVVTERHELDIVRDAKAAIAAQQAEGGA